MIGIDQCNRIENQGIDPHRYDQLILHKVQSVSMEEQSILRTNDIIAKGHH